MSGRPVRERGRQILKAKALPEPKQMLDINRPKFYNPPSDSDESSFKYSEIHNDA